MFGLMKTDFCNLNDYQKMYQRYHYCGVCKTIGYLYGHKNRVFLNSDCVALAEILSSNNIEYKNINKSIVANCLEFNDHKLHSLNIFEFVSSINLLLVELKIEDRIADSNSHVARLSRKIFKTSFAKAKNKLMDFDFPVDEVMRWSYLQRQREYEFLNQKNDKKDNDPVEILNYLAEPTAAITSTALIHGLKLVQNKFDKEIIKELGFKFGALAYLIDAIQDYNTDLKKCNFNALSVAYHVHRKKIPEETKNHFTRYIHSILYDIKQINNELSIPKETFDSFYSRLESNIDEQLSTKKINKVPLAKQFRNALKLFQSIRFAEYSPNTLRADCFFPVGSGMVKLDDEECGNIIGCICLFICCASMADKMH